MSKSEPLYLVHLQGQSILEQLQWEEALLRADDRNWCLINHGAPPAIVMGISGQFEESIDQNKLQKNPIPVIRRFSGGGTVIVDEQTLFVTFICNKTFVDVLPFPEQIMRWTEKIYRPLFELHPFSLRENDYVIGDKKVGGNAQSIVKNRWLHHSSFLYAYDPDRMDYLKIPKKAPLYRQERGHGEFLCCLKDYWPTIEKLKRQLFESFGNHFDLKEVELLELEKVATKPHRKATALMM